MAPRKGGRKERLVSYIIPMSELFGSQNGPLRAELKAQPTVKFSSKDSAWIFTDQALYLATMARLGQPVDGVTETPPITPLGYTAAADLPVAPPPAPAPAPEARSAKPVQQPLGLPDPTSVPLPTLPVAQEVLPEVAQEVLLEAPPKKMEMAAPEDGGEAVGGTAEVVQMLGKSTEKKLVPLRNCKLVMFTVGRDEDSTTHRKVVDKSVTMDDKGIRDEQEVKQVTKMVRNVSENKVAKKLQASLRYEISSLGNNLVSGVMLLPSEKSGELDKVVAECKKKAADFNAAATNHKISVTVFSDIELSTSAEEKAARTVAYKIQRTLGEMQDALRSVDEVQLSNAAAKLKLQMGSLKSGVESGVLEAAVIQARKAAATIRTEAKKKTSDIEEVKRKLETGAVESARFTFLGFAIPEELEVDAASVGADEGTRFSELGALPDDLAS